MNINSPLRYPGGKSALTDRIKEEISKYSVNAYSIDTYIEPFAGGAGIAINLLLSNFVPEIWLNDADPAVFSIWNNIIFRTDDFVKILNSIPVTIDEYFRQKEFYKNNKNTPSFELGVAAYFLNRTNVSGVITGGPIGGINQNGKYKIDCRFNKVKLIKKIEEISKHRNQIKLFNLDFAALLQKTPPNAFIYADPPYVQKGKILYKDSMSENDHTRLYWALLQVNCPCLVSYDDCNFIRNLYKNFAIEPVKLNYSAANKGLSQEILITK